jgi:hypothetical protein
MPRLRTQFDKSTAAQITTIDNKAKFTVGKCITFNTYGASFFHWEKPFF